MPLINLLLFLFLISFQLVCSSDELNKYQQFFEAMTYSSENWREDDFGKLPTKNEMGILKSNSPLFSILKTACSPMNFYTQYVPLLSNAKESGQVIHANRKNLKKFERSSSVSWQLDRAPECIQSSKPPLYAYSWQEVMKLPSGKEEKISVLKYSFVFYKSGLPKKQTNWQSFGWVLGDPEMWHYLDIHGAVFYLLDANNKIFSVVLAQHNHFRSYIVGVDVSEENAKNICFAIRSNEPYFCENNSGSYEFATAPSSEYIRWIVSHKNRPFLGAWDLIPKPDERKQIDYELTFLTSKDPLITSWIPLGPELKIWGFYSTFYRRSPPGMSIFNTPELKQLWKTAQYFYFDPNINSVFDLHEKNMQSFFRQNIYPVLNINAIRFENALSNHRGLP